MANFDINVFMIARDKCFCRVKSDLFQRRRGTVQYRTVPGRASGDVMIYRCHPAPVQYITTH